MTFSDLFNRSLEEQKPLSLLLASNSDDFWFGVISDFNDEALEVRLFDGYGEFDGYILSSIDEIKGVEYDDEYEMVTAYLIAENSFMTHIPDSKVELAASNWRYQTLSTLMSLGIPVEISVEGKSRMGYLESVGLEAAGINLVDSFGDGRGRVLFKMEDVEHIRYFSKKIRKAATLYEWRNKKK